MKVMYISVVDDDHQNFTAVILGYMFCQLQAHKQIVIFGVFSTFSNFVNFNLIFFRFSFLVE